jgi:hypothetical protein
MGQLRKQADCRLPTAKGSNRTVRSRSAPSSPRHLLAASVRMTRRATTGPTYPPKPKARHSTATGTPDPNASAVTIRRPDRCAVRRWVRVQSPAVRAPAVGQRRRTLGRADDNTCDATQIRMRHSEASSWISSTRPPPQGAAQQPCRTPAGPWRAQTARGWIVPAPRPHAASDQLELRALASAQSRTESVSSAAASP